MGIRKRRIQRFVAGVLIFALIAQILPNFSGSNAAAAAIAAESAAGTSPAKTDIAGHWAEASIRAALQDGIVSGFPDGSFHPDDKVTRAELAAILNRAFPSSKTAAGSFTDVPAAKWYATEVAKASAAGYMQGDGHGLFRPEASVTREESAVVIARLLGLDTGSEERAGKFADAKSFSAWSRGAVSAVATAGIMTGYAGNRFKPGQSLTRAEAVVLLEHARRYADQAENTAPDETGGTATDPTGTNGPTSGTGTGTGTGTGNNPIPDGGVGAAIDRAGTYGPASGTLTHAGDLAINVPSVVLRNVAIQGDLLLGEGIGEGDVTLDRVVVEGTTTIQGGGRNSVHILDSTLTRVFVTKVDGQVRVVIEGSTAVDQVTVESGATLQVASGSGASYGTVKVSTTGEVTLDGDFPSVVLVAPAQLNVKSGTVGTLTLTDQAAGADVTLSQNTQVSTLNAGAASNIKGEGTIATASVTAEGVTIDQTPSQTIVADGVTANIGGTPTQGGGSSGGGPGTVSVTVAVDNPTAAGFDLSLSPAVPDLAMADLVMVNEDGMPALVSQVGSSDGGANYRAEGFLTGGATYSLTLAKPGYTFGASTSIVVPDVPAVTGAMVSPDLTKLTLLFSKPLNALPDAPAGFALTDANAPVTISGATLSESGTRIELALGAAVHPAGLALSYEPGTIRSTDDKALPAFTFREFSDGGTPGGRAAYDRMLGMTANQAALDLKNDAGLSAGDMATAFIEGGYNTNDLIQQLYTVYGVTNENMPDLLIPKGIGIYNLLIGLKAAGILNLFNLGKNFARLVTGASDEWVRALKQAGYTDQEVAQTWVGLTNAEIAASLRKYYDTDSARAAQILLSLGNFSANVGQVLKDVFGDDDLQAVTALQAADIDASEAGLVLRDVYEDDTNRTAELLQAAGYPAEDVGDMFILDYGAAPEDTAKAMRAAGYTIDEIYFSLRYAPNPAAALRSAYTVTETYPFLRSLTGRLDSNVDFLKTAGYSAVEAATVVLANIPHTRTDLMNTLLIREPDAQAGLHPYGVDEALDAVRKLLGGSLTDLAALLAQLGVPTVTTMQPGDVTQVAALVKAGFTYNDILSWLAPSRTLTQAQASNVLFELRNAGYPLNSLKSVILSLSSKVYFGDMSSESQIRLLAASGMNTATNQEIPGYSASEIAKYLILTGQTNNYGLGLYLPLVFTKLETVQAIVDASGTTLIDMLRVMGDGTTRLFQGAADYTFMGQVLKDIYGASPVEAAIALRGSNISSMNEIFPIQSILRQTYEVADTAALIHALAEAGFTTYEIGVGLNLNGQSFKDAGYPATDVAQFIRVRLNTQMDVMVLALKNLGYSLDEITLALRNMYGNSGAAIVTQVTDLLNAPGNGFTSEQVTASVNAVFGIDSFTLLAQSMKNRGTSAVQAASTLKGLFADTGAIDMANGLKNAGYSQGDVLIAIFRTYCGGYIYATNALSTMDEVIAQVYPEVTDRLAATLQASDVKTAKYAVSVLQWLERPLGDAIAILNSVYGLDDLGTLDALLQNRSSSDTLVVMNAVGAYYHEDGLALYLKWLHQHNYTEDYVLYELQHTYGYNDEGDSVTVANLMQQAGYSYAAILNAFDDRSSGNIPAQIATVMVQVFGDNNLDVVAEELYNRGFDPTFVFSALLQTFPNKTQGAALVAMKASGYADLRYTLASMNRGDATVVAQLRNLGLSAVEAIGFQSQWQYSLRDQIRNSIDLGYSLSEVGHALGDDPQAIVAAMLALPYSFDQIVAVVYARDSRPSLLIGYLYKSGYTNIDDLVKALTLVHEEPRKFVADLVEMKYTTADVAGPARNWTATTLAVSISRNSQLTFTELGQSFLATNSFTKLDIYYALKAIADIGVSFIQSDLDSAISAMLTDLSDGIPFAILREAGLGSNDAARVMKQLGWGWIPACIQLVQAGYGASDVWGTLWDVYQNELGFQVLNIMSAVAPLASLGLADNLTTFQSVLKGAMQKAMVTYFTR